MNGIDLSSFDDVLADLADVRARVGSSGYAYLHPPGSREAYEQLRADVVLLAESVADLTYLVREKLSELAGLAGRREGTN